jgi:hypothetical protein
MSNFEDFFAGRDELLEQFVEFNSRFNLHMLSNLKEEDNKDQFLSKVTEMNFGIFFSAFASSITHQPSFSGLTPDWSVTVNGQKVVLEVLRLNAAKPDKLKMDFIDRFIDKVSGIPIGAVLSLSILEESESFQFDLSASVKTIESWLATVPREGAQIVLFDCLEVELVNYSGEISNACLIVMGGQISYDYRRLSGPNSPILKKVRKYSDVVEKKNLPFIICVYADFHTWFRGEDLFKALYGPSCTNLCGIYPSIYTVIEEGLFYKEGDLFKNVSGILLRMEDRHSYFHNYSHGNRLNEDNQALFKKFQFGST